MRTRALVAVVLALALAACTESSGPSRVASPALFKPMRVSARIPNVYPQEVEFTRGSIWVLAGVNGPVEQIPVVRIDPTSNKVIARIETSNGRLSGGGWQMADDPTGLWIVIPTMSNPGDGDPTPVPKDIQTAYRGGRRIRADLNHESIAGGLALINPDTNKVLRRVIFLDWTPTSLVSTPTGLWIVVGDRSGAVLTLMDTKTGVFHVIRRAREGMLRSGFGSVWGSAEGGVHRLDPMIGKVLTAFNTGTPRDLAIGPDAVWVTTDKQVIRIDPATNRIVARINLVGSWGIAADGRSVVVTLFRNHQLVRIDPARNAVVDRVDLGAPDPVNPITTEVTVADGSAWVVNGTELVRVALG
jgi:DNA-binding beta-propeller fold protein YncE